VRRLSNVREGELRGASGEPKGVHAGQVERPAGTRRAGHGAWPQRRRRRARRDSADGGAHVGDRAGVQARGCGLGHDGQHVSLAVTAYGQQAGVGPARCAGAAPMGDVARVGALRRSGPQPIRCTPL
jgi:hypothetical protein